MFAITKLRAMVGLAPSAEADVVDVDDVADLPAGQVDRDVVGDVACGDFQLDFGTDHGQRAAALQAGEASWLAKVDVDEQLDQAFIVDAHEIDVRRQVLDHIALNARQMT
jgi:hypothetical protein